MKLEHHPWLETFSSLQQTPLFLFVVHIFWLGVDIFEFWQDMNSKCKLECQMNTEIGD